MAHIRLPEGLPGIVGLLAVSPDTATPLRALAEVLLRGANSLTPGERELVAAHVSALNDTRFCALSHGAAAAAHFELGYDWVRGVQANITAAAISEKLKALLAIAEKVQQDGKLVTAADVARARAAGATDKEIHDTVLIAAAFCMFNRYVDGLATWQPEDPRDYREMGERMARQGYVRSDAVTILPASSQDAATPVARTATSRAE